MDFFLEGIPDRVLGQFYRLTFPKELAVISNFIFDAFPKSDSII